MPMHLHLFAHIVAGALRAWWQSMVDDTDAAAQHAG
jgi:hypothetical protein